MHQVGYELTSYSIMNHHGERPKIFQPQALSKAYGGIYRLPRRGAENVSTTSTASTGVSDVNVLSKQPKKRPGAPDEGRVPGPEADDQNVGMDGGVPRPEAADQNLESRVPGPGPDDLDVDVMEGRVPGPHRPEQEPDNRVEAEEPRGACNACRPTRRAGCCTPWPTTR